MSASDAAPLPRLGEVFFDVRGHSRSMRLSWYADTGVAVFSIWQGGVCTGTFRLPIADLSRMIQILQQGPGGGFENDAGGQRRAEYAEPRDADEYPGDYGAEYGRDAAYGRGYSHRPGDDDFRSGHFRADDYGSGDFGEGDYDSADYGYADYQAGDHNADLDYGPGQHRSRQRTDADYGRAEYGRSRGERPGPADEAGYGQQRFVPRYVRGQDDSAATGYLADSDYRRPADPGGGARHSGRRRAGGPEQ
jgi:hypothetical protein